MSEMTRVSRIVRLLSGALNPEELRVIDDSVKHKGHFGPEIPTIETHMIIQIKAEFGNITLVEKHRKIKTLLKEEFEQGLHALNIEIL